MSKTSRSLVRGFWALDRFLGGNRPPTSVQRFVARHPLVPAAGIGLAFLALVAAAPGTQGVDVQVGLTFGAFLGLTYYVTAKAEAARQRRLVREGLWKPTGPRRHGRRSGRLDDVS
ncbi:hypothetical protein [Streptomyces sp. NPDC048659]|uniref:hypothetical protein n=1 Tax=Streptomyces sp. NPDC048659 TaxID=3155489 RepID=UPI00343A8C7D